MAAMLPTISFLSYAGALASCILLYIIGVIFYRVCLHPLSTYPGPRLWAATRLPYAYHVINGTLVQRTTELHREYGSVVRIAPTELSYIMEDAWDEIYGKSPHGKPPLKKAQHFAKPAGVAYGLLNEPNEADHTRMRRIIGSGFSERALRDQEPIFTVYIDKLIQRLHENSEKPVDIVQWFIFTTFDAIGDLTLGESFDCLETSKQHFWVDMFFTQIKAQVLFGLSFKFSPLDKILRAMITKEGHRLIKKHTDLTVAKLDRRLNLKEPRPDFLSEAQRTLDTPNGISTEELKETVSVIVVAGAETTATALSGTIYYILKNRNILQKLTAEIRGAFKNESEITMVSTNGLSYQLAVLNETLRIMPPAASTLPRVTPPSGSIICGRFVPGNTAVGINNWAASHSPNNFKDPYSYIPERWLEGKDQDFKDDKRRSVQPFSVGPRNCLGRNLAFAEMRVILARLIWNFDLELCEESESWTTGLKVWLVYDKPSLWVKLKPVIR